MKALLEAWSQIEPERCRVVPNSDWFETLYSCNEDKKEWWVVRKDKNNQDTTDVAMLLISIINAIDSLSWDWCIGRDDLPPISNYAFVRQDIGKVQLGGTPKEVPRGKLPPRNLRTEALLKAYLQALKQEQAVRT